MTSAEWAEAFRTGNPEKVGETLLREWGCLVLAGPEVTE